MTQPIDLDALQALLPCPFCGAEPLLQEHPAHTHSGPLKALGIPDHPGSWTIECPTDGCCGMIGDTRETATAAWNRRADTGTTSAQPGQEQPRDENAETETHVVRMAAGDEINLSYERLAEGGNAQILQRRDVAAASDGGSQSAANPVRQLSATPAQEHPQVKRNALSLTPEGGKVRQAEEGK